MRETQLRTIEELAENLKNGGSAAHAYILEGRSAGARERFINELTEALGCTALDTVRMQKSGKSSYRAEDASAFSERLMMGAYGSFLAGIIEDADSLSEIVQNKLLKTIEEPNPSVVLLLGVSNAGRLLGTVRSRCVTIRISGNGAWDEDSDEAARAEQINKAAAMMTGSAAFHEFRDAVSGCVKSKADALSLIDALEDALRDGMLAGADPAGCAEKTELAETARADIERDMDRNRALKRLFLEIKGQDTGGSHTW